MDKNILLVKNWQEKFGRKGHVVSNKPTLIEQSVWKARFDFIEEENAEYQDANESEDLVGVLDALLDLQYFLYGAVLIHGFQDLWNEAFEIVHNSNMSKLGEDGKPIIRADGKILKGPNYWKPEKYLKKLLEKYNE